MAINFHELDNNPIVDPPDPVSGMFVPVKNASGNWEFVDITKISNADTSFAQITVTGLSDLQGNVNVGGNLAVTGTSNFTGEATFGDNITFSAESDHTISVADSVSADTDGGALTLLSGAGVGPGAGGTVTVTSGAGGATGDSGALVLSTGAGSASGNSGAVSLVSGGAAAGDTGSVTIGSGIASATAGDLNLQTNGIVRWIVNAAGHYVPFSNNTYDIGTDAAAVRSIYVATSVVADTWAEKTADAGVTADGVLLKDGAVVTDQPSPSGAGAWKLGTLIVGVSTPDATQYLEVSVGGVVYKLVIAT